MAIDPDARQIVLDCDCGRKFSIVIADRTSTDSPSEGSVSPTPNRSTWTVTLDEWAEFEETTRALSFAAEDAREARDSENAERFTRFKNELNQWQRAIFKRHWTIPVQASIPASSLASLRDEMRKAFEDPYFFSYHAQRSIKEWADKLDTLLNK